MCGRYYIASEDASEEMRALIDEVNRRIRASGAQSELKTGEIFPTNIAPVIANSKSQNVRAFPMRWGMEGFGATKSLIINARSETAKQKPMFRQLWTARRCLVPASGYFEWEKRAEGKFKYFCHSTNSIIRMAGLYRPRADGAFSDFVILTRPASPLFGFIHARMPVILTDEAAQAWLNMDADPAEIITRALEDEYMRYEPAGA